MSLSETRGQSTVELAIGLPVLLLVVFGALAFFMAEHARTTVIDAARAGARLASIECGNGVGTWQRDTVAIVQQTLRGGGLHLAGYAAPAPGDPPGSWSVAVSCAQGEATVSVSYSEDDLFPPMGALVQPGAAGAGRTFLLRATVVFPLE